MSAYRLDKLMSPHSLAVVGGSPREKSLGRALLKNLRDAKCAGTVHLINTRYAELDGVAAVCTENSIRVDSVTELPIVNDDGRAIG